MTLWDECIGWDIYDYSAVSHDTSHGYTAWRESDWSSEMKRHQAQENARCRRGWGLGTRLPTAEREPGFEARIRPCTLVLSLSISVP